MSLRCRSCNIAFHDNASLEVHYQYAHSNGDSLPDTSRPAELDGESAAVVSATATESNNNHFFKFHGNTSPDNQQREFQHLPTPGHHPARDPMYETRSAPGPGSGHPAYDNFMVNSQEYARGSSVVLHNSSGGGYAFNEQRYHPYFKQSFREVQRPMLPGQSLHHCDKCDFHCTHPDLMMQHHNLVHNAMPNLGLSAFNPRFGNPVNGGAEPQAEILDLDSHKVHVYQPPNGEDSQDSDHRSMDPWAHDEKKYFHPQQPPTQQQLQVNQNGATNGRGGTPLPSPDFGNVSTTTDNIENLQSSTRSPYYEQNSSVNSTPTQISSTDNPNGRSSSKGGKNSNGTWKSNEARRPKTYNCSACNKWFTSSGHLKRHYNTTLHKNAVKQSGAPDPATLPVSAHHHPQKDPSYTSSRQVKNSPPVAEPETPPGKHEAPANFGRGSSQIATPSGPPPSASAGFLHSSPNLMAGPSEVPGGLLHPSYTQSPEHLIKSPSPITALPPHSSHSNYLPFGPTQPHHTTLPFFQQATPTTLYPNFQSPHVSTTHQVTPNNHIGNLTDTQNDCIDVKLPSFACIQKNGWNSGSLDQFFSSLDNAESNVGGPFTSKEVETTTEMLLKNLTLEKSSELGYATVKVEPTEVEDAAVPVVSPPPPPPPAQRLPPAQTVEESNVTSSTERTSPLATADFRCPICNKSFNKACYLTQHNKSFHSGDKPYKCARCGKRYPNPEQFNSHLAKHSGDKPHKCEACPKAFNHKTDLRRHACLHTDVRPYSCDICNKGFIRKDHMLKHRETHTNRKTVPRKLRDIKVKKELELNLEEVVC